MEGNSAKGGTPVEISEYLRGKGIFIRNIKQNPGKKNSYQH